MASAYDEYMNKRSWLIDTAETPKDKKNLKAELAKLDAKYKAQVMENAKKNMTPAQKEKVASESRRSNQPRAGKMIEEDQPKKYSEAVKITKKPAKTLGEKVAKKQAEASAQSYEKRFPTLSERKPGTQSGHAVTTSKDNTKPVAPAPKKTTKPAMPTKRPAVGTDADAKKKYGSSSWNNGYTN